MAVNGVHARQESPFRETAWDQHLDKMLDDLKTTVNTDGDGLRRDNYNSSFRSSSRSDSRTSNRVEDGGLMKHHHKEYTSPDKTTKVITDEFEYDSGDPNKSGQYHKKVKKSTYSSYKVKGGISDELDALRHGPSQSIMDAQTPDPKVVSASQKVANKLVNALSSIAGGGHFPSDTMKSTSSGCCRPIKIETEDDTIDIHKSTDVCRKTTRTDDTMDINNLDFLLNSLEEERMNGDIRQNQVNPMSANPATKLNGDMDAVDEKGGEVRRIVWRNRFEKSETHDSSTPTMTIEDDSYRTKLKKYEVHTNEIPEKTFAPVPPQPGHTPTDHFPHGFNQTATSSQPTLQVAPSPRQHSFKETVMSPQNTSYSYSSSITRNEKTNTSDNTYATPLRTGSFPRDLGNDSPSLSRRGAPDPNDPNSNLSITINKTTTHTTHTHEYGPEPTRYTKTGFSYTSPSDSLERLKKNYQHQPTKPFPEVSSVQHPSNEKIPKHVDDLMTSFDGQERIHRDTTTTRHVYMSNGTSKPTEHEPLLINKKPERRDEIDIKETPVRTDTAKREESKNLAGPPVYYPPGHNALFDESMHTMTLKENNRKGMAKWRREKAEYESSSKSASKGGGGMVPVCLPLCCGAACVLM